MAVPEHSRKSLLAPWLVVDLAQISSKNVDTRSKDSGHVMPLCWALAVVSGRRRRGSLPDACNGPPGLCRILLLLAVPVGGRRSGMMVAVWMWCGLRCRIGSRIEWF